MNGRIYIAGVIGISDFDQAEKTIALKGDEPVNPLRFCDDGMDWRRMMRLRLKKLADCDGIYMLKGWKMSKEAKMEHFVALKLKLSIELEK